MKRHNMPNLGSGPIPNHFSRLHFPPFCTVLYSACTLVYAAPAQVEVLGEIPAIWWATHARRRGLRGIGRKVLLRLYQLHLRMDELFTNLLSVRYLPVIYGGNTVITQEPSPPNLLPGHQVPLHGH
jgi:hypothetical protein